MGFRFVPNSMTLNDLEHCHTRYSAGLGLGLGFKVRAGVRSLELGFSAF